MPDLQIKKLFVLGGISPAVSAAALFHSLGNLALEISPVIPTEENHELKGMILITLFYWLFAAILLFIDRKK